MVSKISYWQGGEAKLIILLSNKNSILITKIEGKILVIKSTYNSLINVLLLADSCPNTMQQDRLN